LTAHAVRQTVRAKCLLATVAERLEIEAVVETSRVLLEAGLAERRALVRHRAAWLPPHLVVAHVITVELCCDP